jgi:hypothetical protein
MLIFRKLLWTLFICTTLFAGAAIAQSNLTQIRDTVSNSDGSAFNGTVVITWNGFTSPSSGTPLSTSARVYNGALSVLLVPTSTSTGAFYQVVYTSTDGLTSWTETWQVNVSATPLTISQVRTSTTQGGGGTGGTGTGGGGGGPQYATLPISISQVTSLGADLAAINAAIASLSAQIGTVGSTQGSNAAFVDGETMGGTANGTATTFTVAQTPFPVTSVHVYRNGLLQKVGTDYTIAGKTITFLAGSVPKAGDLLTADYRVTGSGPLATFTDAETPTGTINGSNNKFTLAVAPSPALSLKLYKNGVLLAQNAEYTLSGNTITFTSSLATPQAGDLLIASYRH